MNKTINPVWNRTVKIKKIHGARNGPSAKLSLWSNVGGNSILMHPNPETPVNV
jgi:hypothetical protein